MRSHTRKSSRDPKSLQESYSARERIFAEPREVWEFSWITSRQGSPRTKGSLVKTLWSGMSYEITSWGVKESDPVRSTIWHECAKIFSKKRASADMALRESNRRIHSHRKELHQARCVRFPRKVSLQWKEIGLRFKFRNHRMKWTLNDSRGFHDPETASSSGLSHVPSHLLSVPSSFGMPCRDSCPQPDTRNSCGFSGNVFHLHRMNRQHLVLEMCMQEVLQPHMSNLCLLNTGRSEARMDELQRNTHNLAVPTPRFARKFSTWSHPSHVEGAYPQNCMVEQPRNQVSEMHFDKFPAPSTCQCWKTSFKTEVCSCSGYPSEAMHWMKEVEMVESVDDLKSWQSTRGRRFPNFEVLDVKIASSL